MHVCYPPGVVGDVEEEREFVQCYAEGVGVRVCGAAGEGHAAGCEGVVEGVDCFFARDGEEGVAEGGDAAVKECWLGWTRGWRDGGVVWWCGWWADVDRCAAAVRCAC